VRVPPQRGVSSRYAWIYTLLPDCFKWAGMAAFASHQVRLALLPFRLDRDRTGYVDISIVTSIVPRFRRFDGDALLADASLRRIFDEARDYASNPCILRS
jgi:hypothetical protein